MFANLQQKATHFMANNASTILTGVGAVGTVSTAVLSARAGYKAQEMISAKQLEEQRVDRDPELTKKDKVLLTGHLFLPPVAVGGTTLAAIILANRVSAKQAAALVAAYSLSERNFEEYKAKTLETLGINKEAKIRDGIAQDRVNKTYDDSKVVIMTDSEVLCLDLMSGRYFKCTAERLTKAMAEIHTELYTQMFASLSSFYEKIDLEPTLFSDQIGWNNSDIPELQISAVTTPDDRPCLSVMISPQPKTDYDRYYD